MRVDAFVIRLRPRNNLEAADLGVRLCQVSARSVFVCYLAVLVPVAAVAFSTFEMAPWAPALVLWWAKPWLDRTILFVLSRAAFGQATRPADLLREQRQIWWSQLLSTLTVRRLSPWRSFTQPVHQLEGLRGAELRKRAWQIRSGRTRAGAGMTSIFSLVENLLVIGAASLAAWFAPGDSSVATLLDDLFSTPTSTAVSLLFSVAYLGTIAFLEPFYVAAGFALYLNRRAELEAWDIEQELRRVFGR